MAIFHLGGPGLWYGAGWFTGMDQFQGENLWPQQLQMNEGTICNLEDNYC